MDKKDGMWATEVFELQAEEAAMRAVAKKKAALHVWPPVMLSSLQGKGK